MPPPAVSGVIDPRPFVASQCVQVVVDHAQVAGRGAAQAPAGAPKGVVVLTKGQPWSPPTGSKRGPDADAAVAVTGHAHGNTPTDLMFGGVTVDAVEHSETARRHPSAMARTSVQVDGIVTVFMVITPAVRARLRAGRRVAYVVGAPGDMHPVFGSGGFVPTRVVVDTDGLGTWTDAYTATPAPPPTPFGILRSWGPPGRNEIVVQLTPA